MCVRVRAYVYTYVRTCMYVCMYVVCLSSLSSTGYIDYFSISDFCKLLVS